MWIKICGITNLADAETVATSGANAVGLNFYAPSRRYVTPKVAMTIRDLIGKRLEVVGVFVNSSVEDVVEIVRSVNLDTVQFHGEETAATVTQFHERCPEVGIIRAYRVGSEGFAEVDQSLGELQAVGVPVQAVLIDAYMPGEFGGTGHQVNPQLVLNWIAPASVAGRIILAGGLRPDNVAAAAQIALPWGVDTASGVEISPGLKCPIKVSEFVRQLR